MTWSECRDYNRSMENQRTREVKVFCLKDHEIPQMCHL